MAGVTLIDQLLQEQRDLTAVERFARWHDSSHGPRPADHYRNLLPARAPRPGEQLAFEVDLDKCSGCKACVTACHSLNGLDEDESWRAVGLLVSPEIPGSHLEFSPLHQHITTACHHCVDPACLNGCPVLAYDKDPITGVVRHLDDQCMGCSYCVMKCPYEVPKYSERLGIVRKCDMCSHRLSAGEAPACAQSCPNEAIRITVVSQSTLEDRYRGAIPTRSTSLTPSTASAFLPDSPEPALTVPTTLFRSRRTLPEEVEAADHNRLRLDSAHWPLILMLILTQTSAGLLLLATFTGLSGVHAHFTAVTVTAFAFLGVGLIASVLHLGRPSKAWRAFLGWRRSWLSREIIVFNAFAAAATLACATSVVPGLGTWQLPCVAAAAALGLAGVFTSSMVYVDTGRPLWCPRITLGNFFGTTLLLGSTFTAVLLGWLDRGQPGELFRHAQTAAVIATLTRTALFFWRRLEIRGAARNDRSPIHWNARVIVELLPQCSASRTALFVVSTVFGVMAIAGWGDQAPVWATVAAVATFSSEILGRYVFFAAGGAKRMPGGVTV